MAIINGYATLAQVKKELGITDVSFNDQIERHIEASSRVIDQDRSPYFFYVDTARVEYVTAYDRGNILLSFPYCVEIDEIAIDEEGDWTYSTVLSSSDYRTFGSPISRIEISPNSDISLPFTEGAIRVTGGWGYKETVPKAIEEACILMSKILFLRKDAVLGVLDGGDSGSVHLKNSLTSDPTIRSLLDSVPVLEVY